jgi:hypothetical protein
LWVHNQLSGRNQRVKNLSAAVLLTVLSSVAVPAIADPSVPCTNQWTIASAPELYVAYDMARDAARAPEDRRKPPQVMPTGDAREPFLVATYSCVDFWLPPAGLQFTIASEFEARRAWARYRRDVRKRDARTSGYHTFGDGNAVAWVLR